jgi:hypothetical protein
VKKIDLRICNPFYESNGCLYSSNESLGCGNVTHIVVELNSQVAVGNVFFSISE